MIAARSAALFLVVFVACGDDGGGIPGDVMVEVDGRPSSFGVDLAPDLEPIAAATKPPALGAIVATETEILGVGVVGVRMLNTVREATILDNWHLGSCTKAMTATLIALAVEAGELSWDATLPELFPGMSIHPGYQSVTLPMLLAHLGGLPRDPQNDIFALMSQPGPSRLRRIDAVRAMLAREPGATVGEFTYSNAGYMVAGAALEEAVNAAWEDLMRIRLFGPLGMSGCQFGPTAIGTQIDQPSGHHTVNGALRPDNYDNPPAFGPAGTVNCPLAHWVAFLQEHLRAMTGQPTILSITPATWTRLHTPPTADSTYALGWDRADRLWSNGAAFTHTGTNTLNVAHVWIAPGLHRIFASVANNGDPSAFEATDDAILMMIDKFSP